MHCASGLVRCGGGGGAGAGGAGAGGAGGDCTWSEGKWNTRYVIVMLARNEGKSRKPDECAHVFFAFGLI